MNPGDRAERREGCEQQKELVKTAHAADCAGRISARAVREPCEQKRFDYEQHEHEGEPQAEHGSHPPEIRIDEAIPKVEPIGHPKPCRTDKRNGDPDLLRETPFYALEQRQGFLSTVTRPRQRQYDQRDECQSADPMDHGKDVQRARQCDVVHRSPLEDR